MLEVFRHLLKAGWRFHTLEGTELFVGFQLGKLLVAAFACFLVLFVIFIPNGIEPEKIKLKKILDKIGLDRFSLFPSLSKCSFNLVLIHLPVSPMQDELQLEHVSS